MKIAVRRLAPEDVPAYRTLMLKGYAEHPDAFTSTPEERASLPDTWWAARGDGDEARPRPLHRQGAHVVPAGGRGLA